VKKTLIVMLVLGLVAGSLAAPAAAKKKKKKKAAPVAVDQKFFLRDADGCETSQNQLSLTDGPDSNCWYADTSVFYDVVVEAGLLTPADLGQTWTSVDGTPFKLDVTKPITGEISTSSGSCIIDGGCAPVGVGAGQAALDVVVTATIDGQPKELGTFAEAFVVTPGATHTSKIEIPLDAALAGLEVESLSVLTYLHGAAVGHGIVELETPASFVTVGGFK
jgi:hypothetical protein